MCNKLETLEYLIGNNPINIQANMYTPNATGHITTLADANYDNKSVIIFGTSMGIIIQVCNVNDIFLIIWSKIFKFQNNCHIGSYFIFKWRKEITYNIFQNNYPRESFININLTWLHVHLEGWKRKCFTDIFPEFFAYL